VAFSPDGKRLASASGERTVKLWDLGTGEETLTLNGHTSRVTCVVFSPDGTRLASASWDNTVKLWNTEGAVGLDRASDDTPILPSREELLIWHEREASDSTARKLWFSAFWHLDRLIKMEPMQWQHYAERAQVHARCGDVDKMALDYQKAAELGGENSKLWEAKAKFHRELGQWDEVVEALTKAIQLGVGTSGLYHRRGWAYYKLERFDEAIADLSNAIELDPGNVESYINRGLAYGALEQSQLAAGDCTTAIGLQPDHYWAHHNRGCYYNRLGFYEKAVTDLTKAIELKSDSCEAHRNRGFAYGASGQWANAAADYAKSLDLDPTSLADRLHLALLQLQQEDTTGYRRLCSELLDHFAETDDVATARDVAEVCALAPRAVDNLEPAVALAEKAMTAEPRHQRGLSTLGAILYRAGRSEAALEKLNQAIEVHEKDGTAWDWLFLAMAFHELGQLEDAREWQDKAVRWMDTAEVRDDTNQTPLHAQD